MTTLAEFGLNDFGWSCLYFLLVVISVALEHHFLYEPWKRHELRRRATGIVTVMGWSLLPALLTDLTGIYLWTVILFGFLFAGVTLWGCLTYRLNNHKKGLLDE